MSKLQRELRRRGYFRKIRIEGRIYHLPITRRLYHMLPKHEVFRGDLEQAFQAESLYALEN
jgi:hypothetical protein